MSKKIIIAFNAEPIVGTAFNYTIKVNGLNLVYPNGADHLTFEYEAFGGVDSTKVAIQGNLSLTINKTLAFLIENYSTDGIVYERVNNTIEVNINIDQTDIVVYVSAQNANIAIDTVDVSNITYVNLKYFFQYKNIVGDEYLCEIFKKNYTGAYQEINGIAIIEKASVNNHLDPIRGGGVQLQLEANKDLTLEDLYSESEQDFSVKLYKNNKIIFRGFLNPDGVYQDYVKDEWRINLDCVDGLGSLSNLSFVQSNGLHFTGKMLAIDVIYQCLKRTGILMNINTSVNITYDGQDMNDDVFRLINFNADRYKKVDDETIMSCEDVLKSILDIFKACITQGDDGEWYIYKPNEIYEQPYVQFRRFDVTNNYIGNKTVNMNKTLGSQIDGFYPHHCTGNQRIEIKGSIGGFRLGYKYGFVSGLFVNPGLVKNGGTLNYDGWTVNGTFWLINDPLKDSGFYFKNNPSGASVSPILTSDPVDVALDDDLTLKFDFEVKSTFGSSYIKLKIKQGIYYLKYAPASDQTPIDDVSNAVWTTNSSDVFIFYLHGKVGLFNLQLPKIPSTGNLVVSILNIQASGTGSTTLIKALDIIPSQSSNKAIEGEFHTVERANRVSSIVKPNQTVYNGDNPSQVYNGTIFDENLDPTALWSRKNSALKQPLLQIAAEEELRIAQRPTKIFRGDFYGYIPYLSLVTINNIAKFMFLEWSYNTSTNVTTAKQLELFVADVPDIVYKYSIDYGNTVKPTIK